MSKYIFAIAAGIFLSIGLAQIADAVHTSAGACTSGALDCTKTCGTFEYRGGNCTSNCSTNYSGEFCADATGSPYNVNQEGHRYRTTGWSVITCNQAEGYCACHASGVAEDTVLNCRIAEDCPNSTAANWRYYNRVCLDSNTWDETCRRRGCDDNGATTACAYYYTGTPACVATNCPGDSYACANSTTSRRTYYTCSSGACNSRTADTNCGSDYYQCSGDNVQLCQDGCSSSTGKCMAVSCANTGTVCTDTIGSKYCSGTGTNTKVVHNVTNRYCSNGSSTCGTGATTVATDAACTTAYSCRTSTVIQATCTATSGITCDDTWDYATCGGWGAYGAWSCINATQRQRTRAGDFCSSGSNACQAQSDTETDTCAQGQVCSSGACVTAIGVDLLPNTASGPASPSTFPVNFTANVTGSAIGAINYFYDFNLSDGDCTTIPSCGGAGQAQVIGSGSVTDVRLFTYSLASGVYQAKVRADRGGYTATDISQIIVNNTAPITTSCAFTVYPTGSGTTQTRFDVTARGYDDNTGDQIYYQYDWDLNGTSDNRMPTTGYITSRSTAIVSQTITHYYPTPGSYTARVRAVDTQGLTGSWASCSATVVASPTLTLTLTNSPADDVSMTPNGPRVIEFEPVTITANVAGTMIGTINYRFDCDNDGVWEHSRIAKTVPPSPPDAGNDTYSYTCSYDNTTGLAAQRYDVNVLVERGTGTATASKPVYVDPPPPPTSNCVNDCFPRGGTECTSLTTYRLCGEQGDGDQCSEWVPINAPPGPGSPCPAQQTCIAGVCQPIPGWIEIRPK